MQMDEEKYREVLRDWITRRDEAAIKAGETAVRMIILANGGAVVAAAISLIFFVLGIYAVSHAISNLQFPPA
jgi:hypothetical protein